MDSPQQQQKLGLDSEVVSHYSYALMTGLQSFRATSVWLCRQWNLDVLHCCIYRCYEEKGQEGHYWRLLIIQETPNGSARPWQHALPHVLEKPGRRHLKAYGSDLECHENIWFRLGHAGRRSHESGPVGQSKNSRPGR